MQEAHILLIEDNEGDIVLTLDAFEEIKIKSQISVVRNGQEALDFLFQRGAYPNATRPDLILLDINIPIYNGHEVLKLIKKESSLKKIPVIILTTSTSPKDINLAYENHANCFIRKPLEMEEFLKALMKINEFWLQISILPM